MSEPETPDRDTVSVQTMELVVAALFMAVAAIVIYDNWRIGAGWGDSGPESGFFPFYIGVIMFAASAVTFIVNLVPSETSAKTFVGRSKLWQILKILIPTAIFIGFIGPLGLYAAAALYLATFMWRIGGYSLHKSAAAGVAVAVFLFWLFEKAFLIPLPKGPLEAALGF